MKKISIDLMGPSLCDVSTGHKAEAEEKKEELRQTAEHEKKIS
jgi:hypothetical protein